MIRRSTATRCTITSSAPRGKDWRLTPVAAGRKSLDELRELIGDQSPEDIRPLLAQLPPGIRYRDVRSICDTEPATR